MVVLNMIWKLKKIKQYKRKYCLSTLPRVQFDLLLTGHQHMPIGNMFMIPMLFKHHIMEVNFIQLQSL